MYQSKLILSGTTKKLLSLKVYNYFLQNAFSVSPKSNC